MVRSGAGPIVAQPDLRRQHRRLAAQGAGVRPNPGLTRRPACRISASVAAVWRSLRRCLVAIRCASASVAAIRCERVAMPVYRDLDSAVLLYSMCSRPIGIPSPSCASTIWMTPRGVKCCAPGCSTDHDWLNRSLDDMTLVGPRHSAQSTVLLWTPARWRLVVCSCSTWFSRVAFGVMRVFEHDQYTFEMHAASDGCGPQHVASATLTSGGA